MTIILTAISMISGNTLPWEHEGFEAIDDLPGFLYDTELSQLLAHTVEILDCLNRLTLSILHPAPHDRLMRSSRFPAIPTIPKVLFPNPFQSAQQMLETATTRLLEHFLSIKMKPSSDEPQRSLEWEPFRSTWSLAFSMLSNPPHHDATAVTDLDRLITIEAVDLLDGGRALETNDERFIASISLSLSEQERDLLTQFLACPEEDVSSLLLCVLPETIHDRDRLTKFLALTSTGRKMLAEFFSLSQEDRKTVVQHLGLLPAAHTSPGHETNLLSDKVKRFLLTFQPSLGTLAFHPVIRCSHCPKTMLLRKQRQGLSDLYALLFISVPWFMPPPSRTSLTRTKHYKPCHWRTPSVLLLQL